MLKRIDKQDPTIARRASSTKREIEAQDTPHPRMQSMRQLPHEMRSSCKTTSKAINDVREFSAQKTDLAQVHADIQNTAKILAGAADDIPQRAVFLHELYVDSKENYAFPLVALHGALWGQNYFKRTGAVGRLTAGRYFYDPPEKERRLAMLEKFSNDFKEANRQVFIDTYTNYHFTKKFGKQNGADKFVYSAMLNALNQLHQANKERRALTPSEHKHLFETALIWEQEQTISPRVKAAIEQFDCPVLKFLGLKPLVRFSYFRPFEFFWFQDFSDKNERIERAMSAYEFGQDVGWPKVEAAIADYNELPQNYLANPQAHADRVRQKLLG